MSNYTHISLSERAKIEVFLHKGISVKEIAIRLNRHKSSLYKELRRNSIKGYYESQKA